MIENKTKNQNLFITIGLFLLGAALPFALGEQFLNLFSNTLLQSVLAGLAFAGTYSLFAKSNNRTMIKNTHLDILAQQFDPDQDFIDNAGHIQLNASGLTFTTLCPCPRDPKKLCPCDVAFNLFDPIVDGANDLTFTKANNEPVSPTVTQVGDLNKYEINVSEFTESDGRIRINITKGSKTIHLENDIPD